MEEVLGKIDIEKIINISRVAGKKILETHEEKDIEFELKDDNSPLTLADKKSHDLIVDNLKELYPSMPILSEEEKETPYKTRRGWDYYWLIDPLDGTKEFVKKIPEFTVNIALIYQKQPIMGVIYTPLKDDFYYAVKGSGAYKIDSRNTRSLLEITGETPGNKITVVASRFHRTKELEEYIDKLKSQFKEVELTSIGSSLKFCLVAEGKADVYPRLGLTMEWDTAAGQIIVEEAGGRVIDQSTNEPMRYNKKSLLNNYFIVYGISNRVL